MPNEAKPKAVNATEFKHRVGAYLDEADFTPILIQKQGRDKSVLVSKRRFDELVEIEKKYANYAEEIAREIASEFPYPTMAR